MVQREDFFERVWELVAEIPYGRVATYGQLADMLGYPRHARLAGAAMHQRPRACPATGSSPQTGAARPTGQSSKCCFCRKAFPFCPAARQILPIIAGKDYKNWKKDDGMANTLHCVQRFFHDRLCPNRKVKSKTEES